MIEISNKILLHGIKLVTENLSEIGYLTLSQIHPKWAISPARDADHTIDAIPYNL